jgi:hypothetical protein
MTAASLRTAALLAVMSILLLACDHDITEPAVQNPPIVTQKASIDVDCTANVAEHRVECAKLQLPKNANGDIIGGQNVYVVLTGTDVTYDAGTEVFQFNTTIQNLMNEAIGTPDGTQYASNFIRVFLYATPRVTVGHGSITVTDVDGTDTFTAPDQPFYTSYEILQKNQTSGQRQWRFNVPPTVSQFRFHVAIETDRQYMLVINEIMANPGGTITDQDGEYVELYNAGTLPVDLQGLVYCDSATSGRRPYLSITTNYTLQPGAYVVMGGNTNTTANGGVPVDISWGFGVQFGNGASDAFKISRIFGTDTLTIDRAGYANLGTVSAKNGVARELKNPALNNADVDGSNWADALGTAVYGPGGVGTPKQQNSVFVP